MIPTRTTDSTDYKQVWHTIRKELGAIGIHDPAFDANKDFIFEWFLNAIRNGAFEGRSWDDSPAAEPYEDSSDEALRGMLMLIFRYYDSQLFGFFITDGNSASREQLVSNTQQSEVPVAMSSPGIALQGKPENADDFLIAEPREGLSDEVLRGRFISSLANMTLNGVDYLLQIRTVAPENMLRRLLLEWHSQVGVRLEPHPLLLCPNRLPRQRPLSHGSLL